MNGIFARKVTVLHKNGFRTDYTHVTDYKIVKVRIHEVDEVTLMITGETDDSFKMRHIVHDKIPIKDLHMTIIDWYLPPE